MKFSTEREIILHPLQQVIGAVERKQTSPVLGNVLIQATAESLTLTASDTEIELQATTPLHVDQPGVTTVPAKKFLDICRALPDQARVDFELSGQQVKIKSGRSRFTLATLPAAEFPVVEEIADGQRLKLNEQDLHGVIQKSSFSMALQDVRFYLNGLLVEIGLNKLCCVATDGHRLAYAEAVTETEPDEPVRAIIPRKSVLELSRLLSSVQNSINLLISNNHLQIDLGDVKLTTKLIEGRFPDYNRVIPIDGNKEIVIDRESLRGALSRAAILSNEKYRGVRLALAAGILTISSNNPDQEEAIDELEVDYTGSDMEIGFNVSYLLEVLNNMDGDEVRIYLKDGNSSILVTPVEHTDNKYVIMPMRL